MHTGGGNAIVTCKTDYRRGFGLANRFIGYSQVVTTINYYTIANLHNLQLLHIILLSVLPLVFTIRFLATYL
jgi:hypothetical protein